MRFFANHRCRTVLMCGILLTFAAISVDLRAQDTQAQGTTRSEITIFDSFLDAHADIDAQLRANPSLLTNAAFLESHPQLEAFLNQHPSVQTEVKENPAYFMEREKRFDARESRRATNPNPDLSRQEVATMDQFLDKYPNIDQDLRRNPSLVNDTEYLQAHPQLQAYLNQHRNLKEEIAENPRYFMQRENRFDAQEPGRRGTPDRDRDLDRHNPNPDLTNQEVATMDQFLDRHPDVAKSLEKKPDLVNDRGYLRRHKDLEEFFSEHPAVRQEVQENPSFFMRRENRLEASNMDGDRSDRDRARARDNDRDRDTREIDSDLNKKELQDMDRFLDKHKKIEKDLQRNPSLANDGDYLKHHKSLEAFLSKNPQVGQELRENPSAFMRRQERLEQRNHRMNNPRVAKPKTKTEEKEEMHSATPR